LFLVGCTERPFLVEATTTTKECLVNGKGGSSRVLRNPRMFLLKLLVARCNDDSSLNGRAVAQKRVDVDNPERESSQHQASDGPWPEAFIGLIRSLPSQSPDKSGVMGELCRIIRHLGSGIVSERHTYEAAGTLGVPGRLS